MTYAVDRAGTLAPGDAIIWLNGPYREHGTIERLYVRRSRLAGTTPMARIRCEDGSRHSAPLASIWRAVEMPPSTESLSDGLEEYGEPDEAEEARIRAEINADIDAREAMEYDIEADRRERDGLLAYDDSELPF